MEFRQFIEADLKYRFDNRWDRLEEILEKEIKKGTDEDRLWVTFTDVPRLNIWPKMAARSGKSTPTGLFAYPLRYVVNKRDDLPTFTERNYMLVFRSKDEINDIGGDPDAGQSNFVKQYINLYLSKKMGYHKVDFWEYEISEILHMLNERKIENINIKNRMLTSFMHEIKSTQAHYTIFGDDLSRYDLVYDEVKREVGQFTLPDDLSIKLSDDVVRLISKDDKYANLRRYLKTFPTDDIEKIVEFHRQILNAESQRTQFLILKALRADELDELHEALIEAFADKNIASYLEKQPKGKEVVQIAKENNVELSEVFKAMKDMLFVSPEAFIYMTLRTIAIKLSSNKWPIKWNVFLRRLGFTNVADMQDTSAIHSGEPTQGVFLDASRLEPIIVIPNKSHIDPRVSSSDEFSLVARTHGTTPSKEQRQTSTIFGTPEQKKYITISAKLRQALDALIYALGRIKHGIAVEQYSKDANLLINKSLMKLTTFFKERESQTRDFIMKADGHAYAMMLDRLERVWNPDLAHWINSKKMNILIARLEELAAPLYAA